jgi:hypothetical protein
MKKIILVALSAAALSAYALPTYEPFTEYATQIAASPVNLYVTRARRQCGYHQREFCLNQLH